MTQPRKSIAELLAEREAAKAEANPPVQPAPPIALAEPEKIITVAVAPVPAAPYPRRMNANESKPPQPANPVPLNQICGARTKRGTVCLSRTLYRSGRCKNHGGMSTGPKSAEGKAMVALNGRAPKKAKPMET